MGTIAEDGRQRKSAEDADTERSGVVGTTVQKIEVLLSERELQEIVHSLCFHGRSLVQVDRFQSIVDLGVYCYELADALDLKRQELLGR